MASIAVHCEQKKQKKEAKCLAVKWAWKTQKCLMAQQCDCRKESNATSHIKACGVGPLRLLQPDLHYVRARVKELTAEGLPLKVRQALRQPTMWMKGPSELILEGTGMRETICRILGSSSLLDYASFICISCGLHNNSSSHV